MYFFEFGIWKTHPTAPLKFIQNEQPSENRGLIPFPIYK